MQDIQMNLNALNKPALCLLVLYSVCNSEKIPKPEYELANCVSNYVDLKREEFNSEYVIKPSMPIIAEYCLENTDNDSSKWFLKHLRNLDTITKIYPYEYEKARSCKWNSYSEILRVPLGNQFPIQLSMRNSLFIGGLTTTHPEKYRAKNQNFYLKLPILENLFKPIPNTDSHKPLDTYDICLIDSVFNNIVPIEWQRSVECGSKEERMAIFSGKYNIHIIGKCR